MTRSVGLHTEHNDGMLECVINISEGQDDATLRTLAESAETALLDVHSDPHHHRAVFTLAGRDVEQAARSLTETAIRTLDLRTHNGVHPRFGVVDVVPFVPLAGSTMADAVAAQHRFAGWLADELGVPSFLYGEHRSLPDVRKRAFVDLEPDFGPRGPHESAGAVAVGARPLLVAYNLWLASTSLGDARRIARTIRQPGLRTLALDLDGDVQVSCNLTEPLTFGPDRAFDAVNAHAAIERAELVGLVPRAVVDAIAEERWAELDLSPANTIEARLEQTGFDEGKI